MDIKKVIEICKEVSKPIKIKNNDGQTVTYYSEHKQFADQILELLDATEDYCLCSWLLDYHGELKCWMNMPDSIGECCGKDCPYRWWKENKE